MRIEIDSSMLILPNMSLRQNEVIEWTKSYSSYVQVIIIISDIKQKLHSENVPAWLVATHSRLFPCSTVSDMTREWKQW